ncbi:hypothetical protein F2Q69_00013690 [Brassica cretica]|uniref:Uncharacterized protein n=1 Tax=Brassica cretica TaxID=69181 RepID=A0A8S9QZS7_BRACR|nr:hypothetical protein F2Q69_00013690 [Brassica cretica]
MKSLILRWRYGWTLSKIELSLKRSNRACNGPIPRRPTGVIEGALWTRVDSFRQSYVSRYWSRESTGAKPSLKYRHTHIHILLLTVLRTGKWKWRSEQ